MGFFDRFKKKATSEEQNPISKPELQNRLPRIETTPTQIVSGLERLDYFAYADPADQNQLKDELGKGLAEQHYFPYIESGSPRYQRIDPRQYILDNETLFEEGGILEALTEMAPLFSKMNIRMKISDHMEVCDPLSGLDHRITINDKPYIIFDGWQGYGWGESAQRFADIINDQLSLQKCNERLYLIHGANDGRAVFLTSEQYALVRPLIDDIRECPLPTKEWCEAWGVTWENIVD